MNGAILQDRLNRAAGRAAAITGTNCDLFRPQSPHHPMSVANRILRLPAAFLPLGGNLRRPVPQTQPLWEGVFDAAYTRPGDIIKRTSDGSVFYIAAQQPMLPVLCVRALRLVTITRPVTADVVGLNLYGGAIAATETTLAEAWPASILPVSGQGTGQSNLAAALPAGSWQVLLPPSLTLQLRTTDRLTDDQGRTGIIASAESSDLGTTLTIRQSST
jgi:hypothetical protein